MAHLVPQLLSFLSMIDLDQPLGPLPWFVAPGIVLALMLAHALWRRRTTRA